MFLKLLFQQAHDDTVKFIDPDLRMTTNVIQTFLKVIHDQHTKFSP